jgi:hypothetical protein
MIRIALLVVALGACGNKQAGSTDKPAASGGDKEMVKVPGGTERGAVTGGDKGAAPNDVSACITNDDPKKHIQPEEGTLAIGKAEGKSGAEATAQISVTPASGYHVSVDFPTELKLEAPAGVKLAKTAFSKTEIDKLTEQGLQVAVKATADKAGAYEVKGCFKFGVCDKESCHPKKQPITIQVAAN